LVGRLVANTSNKFDILRNGEPQTVSVVVGERPDDVNAASASPAPGTGRPGEPSSAPGTMLDNFGARLMPMPEDLRERLGLRPGDTGLAIMEVKPDGLFAKARLEPGIVILEANGRPVPTVEAFNRAVTEARGANRSKILLAIRVGQMTNYLTVDLPG
jgi:serine protease Do